MTLVYFAHPIDFVTGGYSRLGDVLDTVLASIARSGAVAFHPGRAFSVAYAQPAPMLQEINRFAVSKADVVVAVYLSEHNSFGVPQEVEYAHSLGKPVVLITDRLSWAMTYPSGVDLIKINTSPGYGEATFEDSLGDAGVRVEQAIRELGSTVPTRNPAATVRFQLLSSTAVMPSSPYLGDAGLDLTVDEDLDLVPGQVVNVSTGLAVELPPGTWAEITGRSSSLQKRGLLVHRGVIDNGYRGPLYACITKLDVVLPDGSPVEPTTKLRKGERVAQLIIHRNHTQGYVPVEAEELLPSSRGDRGFGSSGA